MERLLHNRQLATRAKISLAILTSVLIYGIWEFVFAYQVDDPIAYIFGACFIAGSVYGLRQTYFETRDTAIALDADPATGAARITFWRPIGTHRIDTTMDKIAGWRLWVQVNPRGYRTYYLLAGEPSYPHVIQFILARGTVVHDLLRKAAPEAIEDFERETGLRRDEPEE